MENILKEGDYKIYRYSNFYYPIVYLIISIQERNMGWENECFIEIGLVIKNKEGENKLIIQRISISTEIAKHLASIEEIALENFLFEEGMSFVSEYFLFNLMYKNYSADSIYSNFNFFPIIFQPSKKTYLYNLLASDMANEVIKLCENSICSKVRKDYFRYKNLPNYKIEIKL